MLLLFEHEAARVGKHLVRCYGGVSRHVTLEADECIGAAGV
jgi:hypothetical protein